MTHLTLDELEAFVRGEEPADAQAFGRHLTECADCARRLADEARLDELLAAAAARAPAGSTRPAAQRRAWSRRWAAVAALIAALVGAGVVMNVVKRSDRDGPAPGPSERFLAAPAAADPGTTDPRADMAAARTIAPHAMGLSTYVPERLALGPVGEQGLSRPRGQE